MDKKISTLNLIVSYVNGEIDSNFVQESYNSGNFDNNLLDSYFRVEESDLYNNDVKDGLGEYENSNKGSLKDDTMAQGISLKDLKDILKPYMTLFKDYQGKLQNPSVNDSYEGEPDPVSKLYTAQVLAGKIK